MALFHLWMHQEAAYHGLSALEPDKRRRGVGRRQGAFCQPLWRRHRFAQRFPHLGALLKTLRLCIRSSLQEQARQRERNQRLAAALTPVVAHRSVSVESQAEKEELRRCVQAQLALDVPEEHLRLLLEYRYSMELKPKEIQAHRPDLFPAITDVHRALEQVMKRLRRRMDIYLERCL